VFEMGTEMTLRASIRFPLSGHDFDLADFQVTMVPDSLN
jgi:hypothetical protein